MTLPTPWRSVCEQVPRRLPDADAIRFWGIGHEVDGSYQPLFNDRLKAHGAQLRRRRSDLPEATPP